MNISVLEFHRLVILIAEELHDEFLATSLEGWFVAVVEAEVSFVYSSPSDELLF